MSLAPFCTFFGGVGSILKIGWRVAGSVTKVGGDGRQEGGRLPQRNAKTSLCVIATKVEADLPAGESTMRGLTRPVIEGIGAVKHVGPLMFVWQVLRVLAKLL